MNEGLIHAIQDNLPFQFWPQREIKLLYGLLKWKPGLPHPPRYLILSLAQVSSESNPRRKSA